MYYDGVTNEGMKHDFDECSWVLLILSSTAWASNMEQSTVFLKCISYFLKSKYYNPKGIQAVKFNFFAYA